jgi:hypothetical protein
MSFLETLDFLPTHLSPTLRYLIYALITLHILAFTMWVYLIVKSLGKNKPVSAESETRLPSKSEAQADKVKKGQ